MVDELNNSTWPNRCWISKDARGCWDAYLSRSPDGDRQAISSIRELFDQVVETLSDKKTLREKIASIVGGQDSAVIVSAAELGHLCMLCNPKELMTSPATPRAFCYQIDRVFSSLPFEEPPQSEKVASRNSSAKPRYSGKQKGVREKLRSPRSFCNRPYWTTSPEAKRLLTREIFTFTWSPGFVFGTKTTRPSIRAMPSPRRLISLMSTSYSLPSSTGFGPNLFAPPPP